MSKKHARGAEGDRRRPPAHLAAGPNLAKPSSTRLCASGTAPARSTAAAHRGSVTFVAGRPVAYDDLPEDCNAHAKVVTKELAQNGLTYVEFKFIYCNESPGNPPFCFNSYPPMFGSNLDQTGALCHETLHPNHGW